MPSLQNSTLTVYPGTTTVNGTAGSIVCSQPFQGVGFKKVYISVGSTFASVGGVVYTFPTPFATVAAAINTVVGVTLTITTSQVTVTVASALGSAALLTIEGY